MKVREVLLKNKTKKGLLFYFLEHGKCSVSLSFSLHLSVPLVYRLQALLSLLCVVLLGSEAISALSPSSCSSEQKKS